MTTTMDLRNLSTTPNQLDLQRRTSISSLSSTSGYSSSTYNGTGGVNAPPDGQGGVVGSSISATTSNTGSTTPQLTNQRLASASSLATNTVPVTSGGVGTNVSGARNNWIPPSNVDVGPWVEQQQQQLPTLQSLGSVSAVILGDREAAGVSGSSDPEVTIDLTSNHRLLVADNDDSLGSNVVTQVHSVVPISSPSLISSRPQSVNMVNASSVLTSMPITDDQNDKDAQMGSSGPTEGNSSLDDDELIPTAIVIKNIPFAIKKEQLLEVMTKLNLPLPYAFNYHFDNGVFRGLAFANFTSTDETSLVVNQLNGREIGGRKLRVEYKKMLPLQERERIEREKREKRGQLEEQHRSVSNASLASLMSAASTTAATKNMSVNGASSSNQPATERLWFSLPVSNNSLMSPPIDLNFNDPETLDLYTQLVLYRDDLSKSVYELALSSSTLTLTHRKVLSMLCSYLNLLELYDNGSIIVRRKPGYVVQSLISQLIQPHAPVSLPQHSSSMMNLNQFMVPSLSGVGTNSQLSGGGGGGGSSGPPGLSHLDLLRSHSQSALPLPRLRQQGNNTPIQLQFPQYQTLTQQQQSLQQHLTPQSQHAQLAGLSFQSHGPQARVYQQHQQQQQQQQQSQQSQQSQQQQQHLQQQQQQQQQQSQGIYSGQSSLVHSPQIGHMHLNSQSSGQSGILAPTIANSSAAALLRSTNRSFVDVRSTYTNSNNSNNNNTGFLSQHHSLMDSPTPHSVSYFSSNGGGSSSSSNNKNNNNNNTNNIGSQPGTPLATHTNVATSTSLNNGGSELNSRFHPFGQHGNMSFSSLQHSASATHLSEYSLGSGQDKNGTFINKLGSLNLGGSSYDVSNSGIWGPK